MYKCDRNVTKETYSKDFYENDITQVKLQDQLIKIVNILILTLLIKCDSGSFSILIWTISL